MIAILEALALGFLILTVVYVLVSVYARSVQREKLEKEWDAGGIPGERQAFVDAGMARYAHSLRRKLIVLVYVLPALAVAMVIYLINRN